eukprot:Lankesteria_metandrocarpae@DN3539_c0_g1_i1.p1
MPTVTVRRAELYKHLGRDFTSDEFQDMCFDFGIELDGEEPMEDGTPALQIEVPANRTDLLCREGIGIALSCFLQKCQPPVFKHSSKPDPTQRITVKASVSSIRPYMLGAILRDLQFDSASYASFIDLQDKLHHNICRRRVLVSVGTHDLDCIQGPYTYEALPSNEFSFRPLYGDKDVDGDGMVQLLESHAQLKQYLHLVRGKGKYPVVLDSRRRVCSAPPIINSEFSKITINTKNVFIDVTAKDRTKATIVLNTLIAAFSFHCKQPFTVEPVEVVYADDHEQLPGCTFCCPDLTNRRVPFSLSYVQTLTGIPASDLPVAKAIELLSRMMITTTTEDGKDASDDRTLIAHVPITRSDILHPCDLAEDIAVAYGFNRIPQSSAFTSANTLDVNKLSDKLRNIIVASGFHECLTWGLLSIADSYDNLRRCRPDSSKNESLSLPTIDYCTDKLPVTVGNPKAKEFEMLRHSLLPSLLKSINHNRHQELPMRFFEIGDIAFVDKSNPIGASNARHCAAVFANNAGSGLEEVHGLLDFVLKKLGLCAVYEELSGHKSCTGAGEAGKQQKYKLVERTDDPAFLPGRRVDVILMSTPEVRLGIMGVLHPEVLAAFSIPLAVSTFEITLKPFLV